MARKPIPPHLIDNKSHKKSSQHIEERKESWNKLQTSSILRVPTHLTQEAKKEWRRIMKLYNQMEADILSDLDRQALIMYCEATAIYKKAQEQWGKLQQIVTANKDGQRMLDDIFRTMERQTKIITSLADQLCLTPVGRARMGMNATKQVDEEDPFLAIINRQKEAKE